MDVPRTALLVNPATHPIHRLIGELKGYVMDTRPLDVLSLFAVQNHMFNSKSAETMAGNEGPLLFVSTFANTGVSTSQIFLTSSSWRYQKAESTRYPYR